MWISGFFGSGKSHLLKMLAILLENREVDGVRAYDLFAPKCAENKILAADLKRAVEIPSRSILFNIDQKADVIAKTQTDALLGVFQKVFDELSGYYGKQPYIAQFERDLDSRNAFAAFQKAYAEVARQPWQRGREQAILESGNIAKAYCMATGAPDSEGLGILDQVPEGLPLLDRGLRRAREGLCGCAGAEIPAEFLRRRGRPVHRRQRQAHDEPSDHRRKPQHQMPGSRLDRGHGATGHGVRHRRYDPAPGE